MEFGGGLATVVAREGIALQVVVCLGPTPLAFSDGGRGGSFYLTISFGIIVSEEFQL